jgi:hypothetical protein
VRDYRHAITYARTRPEVDRERIGIWGSSYSGGHVLVVGAIDRRVKYVVSQVPLISRYRNILRLVRADFIAGIRAQFDQDREARFAGNPPAMVPVVNADPAAQSALPTADSYQWFTETGNARAPAWKNEVTVRTVEMLMEYEPVTYIERVSPCIGYLVHPFVKEALWAFTARLYFVVKGILAIEIAGNSFSWTRENRPVWAADYQGRHARTA